MAGSASIYWISQTGSVADVSVTYQNDTNALESPAGTWISQDGTNGFCAYSNNYLPTGQDTYYYSDYVDTDSEHSFLSLSASILTTCETTFDAKYLAGVNTSTGFYRTMSIADGFIDSAVTPVAGDKFGIFISAAGSVTAKYYRGGTWTTYYTFTGTNASNMYLSFTAILSNTKIINPKASGNIV